MPDTPAPKGKTFLGQPWWMWAIGAAVIVGGYLYLRHSQSTTPQQGKGGGGPRSGGGSWTTESFSEWTQQHAGPPDHDHHHARNETYQVTVPHDMTEGQLADWDHWSKATQAWVLQHDHLTPDTKLEAGQQVTRPAWKN